MGTDRYDNEWRPQRPLRWYEWLAVLLLLALANGVRAGSVYKCIGGGGAVAYQDLPCAADRHEDRIELDAAPAYAPSPEYALDRASPQRASPARATRAEAQAASFECRSADGQVFFRHGGCPHSVPASAGAAASRRPAGGTKTGATKGGGVSVSSRRIDRDEACRQIHRAGAIGRAGHEHDDDVGTYERNLGRDPCR